MLPPSIILYQHFNQISYQNLKNTVRCSVSCKATEMHFHAGVNRSFILHFDFGMNGFSEYLWRIFSASLSDRFIPRSLSDCWISLASMRPAYTVNVVHVRAKSTFYFSWVSLFLFEVSLEIIPSLFLSRLLKVSWSFFSCSLRYFENSSKSSPSSLSVSPEATIFCQRAT